MKRRVQQVLLFILALGLATAQGSALAQNLGRMGSERDQAFIFPLSICVTTHPDFTMAKQVFSEMGFISEVVGEGRTIFTGNYEYGDVVLELQETMGGTGYCQAFDPAATLAQANKAVAEIVEFHVSAGEPVQVASPTGGLTYDIRGHSYSVTLAAYPGAGGGATVRFEIEGVAQQQLELSQSTLVYKPTYRAGDTFGNLDSFKLMFSVYCAQTGFDAEVLRTRLENATAEVKAGGYSLIARWPDLPYVLTFNPAAAGAPFRCAAFAPGFTLEQMRNVGRDSFYPARGDARETIRSDGTTKWSDILVFEYARARYDFTAETLAMEDGAVIGVQAFPK